MVSILPAGTLILCMIGSACLLPTLGNFLFRPSTSRNTLKCSRTSLMLSRWQSCPTRWHGLNPASESPSASMTGMRTTFTRRCRCWRPNKFRLRFLSRRRASTVRMRDRDYLERVCLSPGELPDRIVSEHLERENQPSAALYSETESQRYATWRAWGTRPLRRAMRFSCPFGKGVVPSADQSRIA